MFLGAKSMRQSVDVGWGLENQRGGIDIGELNWKARLLGPDSKALE